MRGLGGVPRGGPVQFPHSMLRVWEKVRKRFCSPLGSRKVRLSQPRARLPSWEATSAQRAGSKSFLALRTPRPRPSGAGGRGTGVPPGALLSASRPLSEMVPGHRDRSLVFSTK